MKICIKCGGVIVDPGEMVMYAGRYCDCKSWFEDKAPSFDHNSPSINNSQQIADVVDRETRRLVEQYAGQIFCSLISLRKLGTPDFDNLREVAIDQAKLLAKEVRE